MAGPLKPSPGPQPAAPPGAVAASVATGPAWWRVPLLLLGAVALVAGTAAGLARLAWPMPDLLATHAPLHGPLMTCGFFGVVIALERAVALGRPWAYAAPLLAGLGNAAALHGLPAASPALYGAGALVLLGATVRVWQRQRAMFTATLVLAAACAVVGCALWALGRPLGQAALWWLSFLVLTIAGERLELSRFMPPSPLAGRVFVGLLVGVVGGLAAGPGALGLRVHGLGLLGLALWLFKQDIARRTVRGQGLTRYIAVCLLAGYAWLAVAGATLTAHPALQPGTPSNDAVLHALGLGFVFSMVFGHAPIILPAVLKVAVPYRPVFYAPLALLHAGVALRLLGDAAGAYPAVRAGGLVAAMALGLFIVTMGATVRAGRSARPAHRA